MYVPDFLMMCIGPSVPTLFAFGLGSPPVLTFRMRGFYISVTRRDQKPKIPSYTHPQLSGFSGPGGIPTEVTCPGRKGLFLTLQSSVSAPAGSTLRLPCTVYSVEDQHPGFTWHLSQI